jgi:hypothetical protein
MDDAASWRASMDDVGAAEMDGVREMVVDDVGVTEIDSVEAMDGQLRRGFVRGREIDRGLFKKITNQIEHPGEFFVRYVRPVGSIMDG